MSEKLQGEIEYLRGRNESLRAEVEQLNSLLWDNSELYTTFELVRDEDETGVSGTGIVASGIIWQDGKCAMHWHTAHTSTTTYDSLEDLIAIHGHSGKTRVRIGHSPAHTVLAQDVYECGVPSALIEGREPYGVRSPMLMSIYRMFAIENMSKGGNLDWTQNLKIGDEVYSFDGMFFRKHGATCAPSDQVGANNDHGG